MRSEAGRLLNPSTSERPGTAAEGGIELSADYIRSIRRKLLNWYDRNARDLPWRHHSDDAYAQWVAEIMLQQTRVDTVIDFYLRFLDRFPNVESLAIAPLDEVLGLWQGLGYYRRAENLHRSAQILARKDIDWPKDARGWQALPGIGVYTAGAIASVALGEQVPAVDGNVLRVLARLLCIDDDIGWTTTRRRLSAAADRLVPKARPGDFNQAWMDLGAAVCTPKTPACDQCPLARECAGLAKGMIAQLPVRTAAKKPIAVERVVLVLAHRNRVLVRQRPRGGRWSGLWEFSNLDVGSKSHSLALKELRADLALGEGLRPTFRGVVKHLLTHRAYSFHIYHLRLPRAALPRGQGQTYRWVTEAQLASLPVGVAHRRVLHFLTT